MIVNVCIPYREWPPQEALNIKADESILDDFGGFLEQAQIALKEKGEWDLVRLAERIYHTIYSVLDDARERKYG